MSPKLGLAALAALGLAVTAMVNAPAQSAERVVTAPVAKVDTPATGMQTAIFAGGCFWGIEGVFSHVKGVKSAVSGYAGGKAGLKVGYEDVSGGDTGYAESVRVTFDPRVVSYGQLLRIFFSVGADPTTLNYQGPDHGTQYRSALFPQTKEQDAVARAYLAQMGASGLWRGKVVTRVESTVSWQPAEGYHQDFFTKNPNHPYIQRWDAPKVAALKAMFPTMYAARPAA